MQAPSGRISATSSRAGERGWPNIGVERGSRSRRPPRSRRTAARLLPLLQFTLETLFQNRGGKDDKTLLLDVYDTLGGLEGAIAREAEKLVADLPPPLREALPGLLLALVDVDEEKETATARTIRRDSLSDRGA